MASLKRESGLLRQYKSLPVGPPPPPSSEAVSHTMRSNRSSGTAPEMRLAKALRKRLAHSSLPGKPDFVYPGAKLVVFVHGCFWHRCPSCNLPLPSTHREFWKRKFERNVERDRMNNNELALLGWRVVEVWEHDIRRDPGLVAQRIQAVVSQK